MKLVSFSVENYRSIKNANKIPLQDYTLLIGPNNEGKSNILHALALAMRELVVFRDKTQLTKDGRVVRRRLAGNRRYSDDHLNYDWRRDYPVGRQKKSQPGGSKVILEFELSDDEVRDFKEEIGSNLNGTLPIQVLLEAMDTKISIQKQGRGHSTLNKKSNRIAAFVSRRIRFEYIPAIRTAEAAEDVIVRLMEKAFLELAQNDKYNELQSSLRELESPILESLEESIRQTVHGFLPRVRDVTLKSGMTSRYRALSRQVQIMIDDGELTPLNRKGDGVQSLVALAIMRHASEHQDGDGNSVVAIEEPESHLHPDAIHELRKVIRDLSENNQVVITSHSPIFAARDHIRSNVIVSKNKAKPADKLSDVRDVLGVRFADNLRNASLIILTEGTDDEISLNAILSRRNDRFLSLLDQGIIQFDSLDGASNLTYKAGLYTRGACRIHCVLDYDRPGKEAFEKARDSSVVELRDVTFCRLRGEQEFELEDFYDKKVYGRELLAVFGVDVGIRVRTRPGKWSDKMRSVFQASGKPWNKGIQADLKRWLAEFASKNPDAILHQEAQAPIDALVHAILSKAPT